MHKNEPICQKCAINCGIEGNASNENITKYKNLSGVKSISNSVQWLARYRIVALISIGRLCIKCLVKSIRFRRHYFSKLFIDHFSQTLL